MDEVFKALADANRRRLLDRLNERNGQTLRELCAGLTMARQSVSKHLAVLEAANLVSTKRQGREKFHFLNPVPINAIAERWMTQYDRARTGALADLKHALEHEPMDTSFVYTTYIKTSPEQLWAALTEPAFTRRYWGVALHSDWQVGSTITWELDASAFPAASADITIADAEQVVLAAEPPKQLSYTWHSISPEFIDAFGETEREMMLKASAERRSPHWQTKASEEESQLGHNEV
jgi:DNA-binding transcriptional ArsR family regulator/uncharacterized protein YndB with AHSA1/START domain